MKTIGLSLTLLCFLASPALAVEYQGQSIDGRKLTAKVYSYATGAVYDAQVQFDRDQAAIVFAGGGQLTLKLRQSRLSDSRRIDGYGNLGQIPIGRAFRVGLDQNGSNNDLFSGRPQPLQDFWSIQLDSANFPSTPAQP